MVKSWVQPVAQDRESTKWTIAMGYTTALSNMTTPDPISMH